MIDKLLRAIGEFKNQLYKIKDDEVIAIYNLNKVIKDLNTYEEYSLARDVRYEELSIFKSKLLELEEINKNQLLFKDNLNCIEKNKEELPTIKIDDYERRAYLENLNNIKNILNKYIIKNNNIILKFISNIQKSGTIINAESRLNGELLQKYYLPSLAREYGYNLKHRVFPLNGEETEIDVHGEKNFHVGLENLERLTRKEILIAESKNKIKKSDIRKFKSKCEKINKKYEQESYIWRYELKIEAWIVACYGWTDELKEYTRSIKIIPIDRDELIERLREHRLLDRRNPPCP